MPDRDRGIVVVAGGAGFLGSHLVDALIADGERVICIDSFKTGLRRNLVHLEREPRFDLLEADIIAPLKLPRRKTGVRAIYNLACAASPPHYQADPEHTMLTSVLGTRNLLTLAEESGARFLLASTSEVYGDPMTHPQPESYWGNVNPTGPRACYDEGKRAAEALTFDYARAGRTEVRVARIFNTYGPRMRADDGRVISNVVTQALLGEEITVYGDGSQTRSFCYATDLIDGLMRLMRAKGQSVGPINLGNPGEFRITELVDLVLELTGLPARIVRRPLPTDDPRRRRPDISLARSVLGWAPKTSLEAGLTETIAWFESELERSARRPRRPKRPVANEATA